MKKNTKKRSWLYTFYKENVMYVWIVVGIIVVSGFSIGMSIGKLSQKNNVISDGNIGNTSFSVNDKTGNDSVAYNSNEQNNVNENNGQIKNESKDSNEIDLMKEDRLKENNNQNTPKQDKKEELKPSVVTSSNDVQKVTTPTITQRKLEFIMPIEGEVVRDFTTDTLVYSNTLQEWISHEGIDIAADIASPVKAIESGEVIEVKNDPRYGYIVIIDHGQGYESIYCNLSTLDMVTIGKKVDKGQVISGVGNTALFEIKDNPHLHFELIKDGKIVNPVEYIK